MKTFEVYDNFMKFDFINIENLKLLGIIKASCLPNAIIKARNKYNTIVKLKEITNE